MSKVTDFQGAQSLNGDEGLGVKQMIEKKKKKDKRGDHS